MFYAIDQHGCRTHISKAAPVNQYYCPVCHQKMITKDKGGSVAHHFAHKSRKYCDPWYNKMSQWHYEMQNLFPEYAREVIVHNEDKSEFHIADILLKRNFGKYVFEFQHSSISADDFICRSSFYLLLGYSLTWVFDLRDSQKPKCLYYENVDDDIDYRHIIWPGNDRIRWLDSDRVRIFLEECMDNNLPISILFHVHTGPGIQRKINYSNGFQSTTWEYIDPFSKKEYFIRPDFSTNDSLSSFYGRFYSRAEYISRINKLIK